jgi:hypothetical protein
MRLTRARAMLKNITQFTTCDLPAACQSLTRVINKTLGHNKSVIHFIITAHPFFWIFFDLLFPVFFLERIHSFMYISTFFFKLLTLPSTIKEN